jgi:hypothetical protein
MLLAIAVATVVPFIPIGGDTRFYLPAAFAYLIMLTMVAVVVVSVLGRWLTSSEVPRILSRRFKPS